MTEIAHASRGPRRASGVSAVEKREVVQRVVNSEMFRRSSALCAFLVYITDHEILGQADKLKEHTIGVEVLGRKPDYLPMSDNIVRVRAHELRGRLDRYFASEGANEPIVINVPLGSYVPEFVPRKAASAEKLQVSPIPATELSTTDSGGRRRRWWLWLAASALIALSASFAVVRDALRSKNPMAVLQPAAAIQDFWGQFFNQPNEELNVVYADPGFALWQELNGKTLNLGDYLNRKYLNVRDDKLMKVAVRPLAGPADIEVAVRLGVLAGKLGGQINLQFARNLSPNFFQTGNVVLIGSRRSNPWVELYEPSLNFILGQDPHSGSPVFRNRSPRPGERRMYPIRAMFDRLGGNDEPEYLSYGVVALLKDCGNRGLTVLAEGLNRQGTEAAGDFLTDSNQLETLLKSMGHEPGTNVAPFEALIQITSLPTSYDNPKVIAYRPQPRGSCVVN